MVRVSKHKRKKPKVLDLVNPNIFVCPCWLLPGPPAAPWSDAEWPFLCLWTPHWSDAAHLERDIFNATLTIHFIFYFIKNTHSEIQGFCTSEQSAQEPDLKSIISAEKRINIDYAHFLSFGENVTQDKFRNGRKKGEKDHLWGNEVVSTLQKWTFHPKRYDKNSMMSTLLTTRQTHTVTSTTFTRDVHYIMASCDHYVAHAWSSMHWVKSERRNNTSPLSEHSPHCFTKNRQDLIWMLRWKLNMFGSSRENAGYYPK